MKNNKPNQVGQNKKVSNGKPNTNNKAGNTPEQTGCYSGGAGFGKNVTKPGVVGG